MLTKQVINAAMLLNELKANTEVFRLKEFCKEKKLSSHFMEQIGRKLVRAKVIKSKRGPGGGYSLNKEVVTLAELLKLYKTRIPKDQLTAKAMKALETINVLE